jgi:hypothetical protein
VLKQYAIAAGVLITALTAAIACGDDDGGEATKTPFIAPPPLTIEEAIAELDAIIDLIENPDPDLVDAAGIGEFELQTRIDETVDGTPQVPGLNEVSELLADEDRILAREYLHNNLVETLAIPFTESDTATISADEMQEMDPLEAFAPRGEDLDVSAVFQEAIVRGIALWYVI